MYKGLASLVGMTILGKPQTLSEQIDLMAQHWQDFDFFFVTSSTPTVPVKTETSLRKGQRIEELDAMLPA